MAAEGWKRSCFKRPGNHGRKLAKTTWFTYTLSHKSRKSSLSPISPTYTLHKKASSLRVVDFVKYISRQSTTSKASIITELTIS